jgi:1-acyl-sn-glycerol-3-phosphate acyltransferase
MAFVQRWLGACFVERVDASRGIEDTAEVARTVAAGSSIVFFPEGTFTRAPGLAAFRLGAFSVAAATGAEIVPTVLQGTRSVLRDGARLPERHLVRVAFAPAERPAGSDWSAAVELRERARAAILSRCGEPDLAA